MFLLATLACQPAIVEIEATPDPALARFGSCEELRGWVAESWTETLVDSRYGWDVVAEDGGDGGDGGSPESWSETNVQEQGVDEPDLVKTDGESIFVAQRGELTVVDSWPPEETARMGGVDLEHTASTLFLDAGIAVTFGSDYDTDRVEEEGWASGYATTVSWVDVSDPGAAELLRTVELEGWYVDARRIDGDIYLVLESQTAVPWELYELVWYLGLPEVDWSASEEEQEAVRDQLRLLLQPYVNAWVSALPLDQLLPAWSEAGESSALLACTDVHRPAELSGTGVLSLVHLDLEGLADPTASGLMADGWTVYASDQSLYVAQSSSWWWGWGDSSEPTTQIHKFDLAGAESTYVASGEVTGWLLNRFSMGEHEGYLRVATTDWGWDDDEMDSHVTVLEEQAGELSAVGHVGGIAPGEQIYTARFLGERGFLVTFFQIDPLFTLDLSDPTDPRVVGELEVPGYSSYLHPVGDDHLVAVGMDGTEDGEITGFQVSLYDVSDLAAPTRVDMLALDSDEWSWSESLWDPHAFTLHAGTLTVPVYTYDYVDGGYEAFSGLWALSVDLDEGLSEIGRIDHSDLVEQSGCLYTWEDQEEAATEPCDETWWYASVRRGVIIEDALYSISDYGIKVHQLPDLDEQLAEVVFWPLAE